MEHKLWVFLKSDGWRNTWAFICKSIISKFYYQSKTYCLFAKRDNRKTLFNPNWSDYEHRIFKNGDDYSQLMNFGRFCLLPYREWFESGSIVCVLFKDALPVAFSWIHFRIHAIEHVGTFDLGDEIAWLGPIFVHRKCRGHGLQKMMIQQVMENLPIGIKSIITSVNASNSPSLKSFEKCGFKVGMKVYCNVGILSLNYRKIEVIDESSKEYLQIKYEKSSINS